eukprot:jgi/Mesvir1/20113/Mv13352-RA.1
MDIEALLDGLPTYDCGPLDDVSKALEMLVDPRMTGWVNVGEARDGVGERLETPPSAVIKFEITTTFALNNIGVLEIDSRSGKYVHTVPKLAYSDIIRDIRGDADIRVMLGNGECDPKGLAVINCLGQYADKHIRVYLDPEHLPQTFNITYTCYLLREDVRKSVLAAPEVFTRTHMYKDGVIVSINRHVKDG